MGKKSVKIPCLSLSRASEPQFGVKKQQLRCFSPAGLAAGPVPDAKKPKLMHGTLLMKDNVSQRVLGLGLGPLRVVFCVLQGVLCPLKVFFCVL